MISYALRQFRYFLKSHLLWVLAPIQDGPLKGHRWSVFTGVRFLRGDYHQIETEEIIRLIRPGDTVYDIGAHIGYYTLIAARACGDQGGQVFAFEPLPVNLKALRIHMNANQTNNITILPYAVSCESAKFNFDTTGGTGRGRLNAGGKMTVTTITLDNLVFEKKYAPPNVIKIDVEGAEVLVLNGALKVLNLYSPRIFLATHGKEIRRECETLLRQQGYELQPFRNSDIVAEKKPQSKTNFG